MREILKPVIVLSLVCIVISFLVAFVFNITKSTILEIERAENETRMNKVLPGGNPFREITEKVIETTSPSNDRIKLNQVFLSESGMVVNVSTKGYAGEVVVFVGIKSDGTINNIQIGKNNETPSVGKKAEEKEFTDRFINRTVKEGLKENIDTISGATITTKAVIEAVQEAGHYFSSYQEILMKEEKEE